MNVYQIPLELEFLQGAISCKVPASKENIDRWISSRVTKLACKLIRQTTPVMFLALLWNGWTNDPVVKA